VSSHEMGHSIVGASTGGMLMTMYVAHNFVPGEYQLVSKIIAEIKFERLKSHFFLIKCRRVL